MKLSDKLDRLLAEAEELLQSRGTILRLEAERQARCDKVIDRWNDLARKAAPLLTDEEDGRVDEAIGEANGLAGPYWPWLNDLEKGRCRLPELSAEAMKELLLAWLHPEVESWLPGIVCPACGLERPRRKHDEWKVLPGKVPLEGPGPWYVVPDFFTSCPYCGKARYDGSWMDWPHLVDGKVYPWMELDGYVGKPIRDLPRAED